MVHKKHFEYKTTLAARLTTPTFVSRLLNGPLSSFLHPFRVQPYFIGDRYFTSYEHNHPLRKTASLHERYDRQSQLCSAQGRSTKYYFFNNDYFYFSF